MEKGYWKKIFIDTCIYFAVISVIVFTVKLVMAPANVYEQLFSVARMLTLLGFCMIMAIANRILGAEKLNSFAKLLLHAALTFAGFFLLIYAPMVADNEYQASLSSANYYPPNIFVVIGIVVAIYAVCYGIYFAVSSKKSKKKNTKSEYKSLYRDKK